MKKQIINILTIFLMSSPSFAQSAEEIIKELEKLQIENASLKAQQTGYDTKISTTEKDLEDLKNKISQLNTKRNLASQACKSISDEDLKLIQGLSAGTIAISGVGTATGAVTITDNVLDEKGGIVGSIKDRTNNQNTNTSEEEASGKTKTTTLQKATNIASTTTSAGSVITSSIALSKVDSLKSQIQKCLDSFN